MAVSGLTPQGFVPLLIPDIRDGMEADIRTTFYRSLPLGDQTLLGHIIGIISEQAGLLWELGEVNYSSIDPDKATGAALDIICALTGTYRQQPTATTAVETLAGTAGTVVGASWSVATASSGVVFTSLNSVVIALLPVWAATTAFAIGARVTNAGQCFQCTVPGISAGAGGPSITAFGTQTDNTVTWAWIGLGNAAVDANIVASQTGPIQATAGDITVIQTPVFGLNTAVNLLDAIQGQPLQSDQSLRITREAELSSGGGTTLDSLRAALLKLPGVLSANVFVNNSDVPIAAGSDMSDLLPPHSFETLVRGGTAQTIVDTIANNLPMGIATHGDLSGTHVDSQGTTETIFYSEPTDINMYIVVNVRTNALLFPADGIIQVTDAIATWGQTLNTDNDVDPSAVGAQAFQVAGVLGVWPVSVYNDVIGTAVTWAATTAYISTVGSRSVVSNDGGRLYICVVGGTSGSTGPTGTGKVIIDGGVTWYYLSNTYVISSKQLAVLDSTRITVTNQNVTP